MKAAATMPEVFERPGKWFLSEAERTASLRSNMWHAYADAPTLGLGTHLLVTGGHNPVRLRCGDRVSIEMPDGQRLTALVLDRLGHSLRLSTQFGEARDLNFVDDDTSFEEFNLSEGFSREVWKVT